MKKNVLLTIAYDGTDFHGWQRQPAARTVQGHLENVMSRLFKTPIILNGTSRTDAGVHAYGQRASFKAELGIPTERIPMVVNNALAGAEKGSFAISPVRILAAEDKDEDFHARFSSLGKEYIYRIRNSQTVDIFRRNYVYHVGEPLDVEAMRQAAGMLVGTHDFKSFEAAGSTPRETTVRTIYDARIEEKNSDDGRGRDVTLYIRGDGFLYNMVRIITGTLVDMGLGRIPPETMDLIMEAKDRSRGGHTAPPCGLYLSEVFYDAEALKKVKDR
ncbi:MAG: tRNA pseudouridine(38-40) synthase TruA [Prevotellaceae bacterium]|nr:tRNA pseudouridine(38-40) synthase TruA [Prevotellaceae bacterium]